MIHTVLIVAVLLAAVVNAGDVLVLTDSDFKTRMSDMDLVLVKFYAPWCGHCKHIAPEFEKAATVLKNNDPPVMLAEVDCTAEGKETCSEYGVSGYPTLKAYKRGEKVFDYDGPREADGIVKHMRSKAGPSSTLLSTVAATVQFLASDEHSIVGFFPSADSKGNQNFQKLATALSDDFRFAHTFHSDSKNKFSYQDNIVIFQPDRLVTKMEPSQVVYTGPGDVESLKDWVKSSVHGLVGHRTSANSMQFQTPLVVVYYDVDYVKNVKGSNYWRNRVMKVAKSFADAGKKVTFAVSSGRDFGQELSEHGLTFSASNDKPIVTGRDASDQKFVMTAEFSVEALEKFTTDMLQGRLEPYLKSEPVPSSNDEPVKVVVAKTFDSIVNDPTKDVLIEFYAPWCGHCKSLAPKFDELALKLKNEDDIVIAKMDATANDVPKPYEVSGFPTLFFAPKGNKSKPKSYEGGREVDEFIKYLARESTSPLKGYTRDGKKVKGAKKDKNEL